MLKGLVDLQGNWIDFEHIESTTPNNWGIGMYTIACDMAKHAMSRQNYCDYSATALSVPVRRYWLERRYDYWIKPFQYADRWIGQAIHASITDERPVLAELCVDGKAVTVGGIPDLVEGNTDIDYKATSKSTLTKIKKNGLESSKPEWVEQLNIYKWLLSQNDLTIDKMVDMVILKSCFLGVDEHFHAIEVPEIEDVEGLIKQRIRLIQEHEKTPDNALPMCMKNEEEEIDNTICQFYCDVKGFCTFDDIEF